jgi:hypothetical protein
MKEWRQLHLAAAAVVFGGTHQQFNFLRVKAALAMTVATIAATFPTLNH